MDWYSWPIQLKALVYVAKRPSWHCISNKPGFFLIKIYKYFHDCIVKAHKLRHILYIKCSCPLIWKCSFVTQKCTKDINSTKEKVHNDWLIYKSMYNLSSSQIMQIKITKCNFLPLWFSKIFLIFNCTHFYEYIVYEIITN